MFGFGKKLTIEEKLQWDKEIKELLANEDFEAAAKKAKEYEKADKAAAAYFLAVMNFTGQGVKQQNLDKAITYIETYTGKYGDDPEGWFYGSSIMLAAGKRDEATEWLLKAEELGKENITRHMAEYFSFMGMSHYNTACLTLNINERKSLNNRAVLYFTGAIQKYAKLHYEKIEALTENDWTQLGYNIHYLHYLALNSPLASSIYFQAKIGVAIADYYEMKDFADRDHTIEYWIEVAGKIIADMEQAGYVVQAAYTKAMLASNEANLNKSKEALDLTKQYLDQAAELSGDMDAKYRDEYELVWKEYERLVKNSEKQEKKGIFGGRFHK